MSVPIRVGFLRRDCGMALEEKMTKIEKSLMLSRGRWVADFNESFRNFKVNDVGFDTFIRGNTRMRGFLLSRVFSATVNPNYSVGCFVVSAETAKDLDRKSVGRLLQAIRSYIKENDMRWAWLFILSYKVSTELKKIVESIKDQFIGVAVLDVDTGDVVHSDSYIGKQAQRFIKV